MNKDLIHHFRYLPNGTLGKSGPTVDCRGGVTVAGLTEVITGYRPNGTPITKPSDTITWGVSKCDQRDNFNKKKGRIRAVGRGNSKKAIVTPNMPYPHAKRFAEVLATTSFELHHKLNIDAYIKEFESNPDKESFAGIIFLKD